MKRVLGNDPKPLQQVLRQPELKVRAELRAQQRDVAVGGEVSVVESRIDGCAPLKSLHVSKIGRVGILRNDTAWRWTDYVGGNSVILVELQRAGELRIESCDRRADAERRTHQTIGTAARTASCDRSATGAGSHR